MKVKKFKVPFYKWNIISIIVDKHEEKDDIIKILKRHKMRKDHIKDISDLLESEATGGGECCYNNGRLLCLILTYPHDSIINLVSTLIHEGRHAADRIIETTGIEGAEAAAYLNEFITLQLIKDYIKDEIR